MHRSVSTTNYSSNKSDRSAKKILSHTLLIFIPIILVIVIALVSVVAIQEELEMEVYLSSEKNIIDAGLKNIKVEFDHILHDLFLLASDKRIDGIWEEDKNNSQLNAIADEFYNVVLHHRTYDQARLLNNNGMEVIRVNFNQGKPVKVPQEKLQDKGNRYYFSETFKLDKGEIYISPFDLNIENNEIEQPLKPMIRIGTPIFDAYGGKRGILIFNYLGNNILSKLDAYTNSIINSDLMLLNSDGYWLKGPQPENEWAFMYDEKENANFGNIYNDAWNIIKNESSGQFVNSKGLYTFNTIFPLISEVNEKGAVNGTGQSAATLLTDTNYHWKLVSYIPADILYASRNKRRLILVLILAIFSISLLLISWKLAETRYLRNKALTSLKISNETKDKFFSIIAHDLRGPFNSLMGFSQMLSTEVDEGNTANIKEYTGLLSATLNRTYNLLINLLDWSRSQTNRMEYRPEPINLFELVEEVFGIVRLQADKKLINLVNSVPEKLILTADKNMIYTVIRNLVSNGIKYSNKDGEITVTASRSGLGIRCSIADDGVGMSNEKVNKLFQIIDVDEVSSLGTDNEKGTGLGLILCKELIEKHDGTVGVESELEKGSIFWFEIPDQ